MSDHMRFRCGCRSSIFAQTSRIRYNSAIEVMPIDASSFTLGKAFKVLPYTLYGDSRVLIPVIPRTVGSCVDMMVILADVTKAEIGT